MESNLIIRVGVTALIGLVAAGVGLWGRRHQRRDPWSNTLMAAAGLAVLVWAPQNVADITIAVLVGVLAAKATSGEGFALLTIWLRIAVLLLTSTVTYALLHAIPGGVETVVAVIAALVGIRTAARTRGFLLRRSRAQNLLPEERPKHEVEVGARLPDEAVPPPPHFQSEDPMGAWRIAWDGGRHAEPRPLLLRSPRGAISIDLERVELVSSEMHRTKLDSMEALAIARGLEHAELEDFAKRMGKTGKAYAIELAWLPPGAAVYVVGRPAWRRMAGSTYRDGQLVPCFEGEDGNEPALVDKSPLEHSAEMKWEALSGGSWGLVASMIAALKLLGWL
jgi:hypothetical protein